MEAMRDARDGNTPGVAHRWRNVDTILKPGTGFAWNPEPHLAPEIVPLESLVRLPPHGGSGRARIREGDRECFSGAIDDAASGKPRILAVEVVDCDAWARAN